MVFLPPPYFSTVALVSLVPLRKKQRNFKRLGKRPITLYKVLQAIKYIESIYNICILLALTL